jgi:hypothetical protein
VKTISVDLSSWQRNLGFIAAESEATLSLCGLATTSARARVSRSGKQQRKTKQGILIALLITAFGKWGEFSS